MGGKGPAPVPTSLLRLTGSREVSKREDTLDPPGGIPEPPPWLSPMARMEWDRLVKDLGPLTGLLTPLDRISMAAMCEAVAIYVRSKTAMDSCGDDVMERRRLSMDFDAADRRLRVWSAAFGLTPSDRTRIRLPKPAGSKDGRRSATG